MLVDLRGFFSGENAKKNIEYNFSLADVEVQGVKPFISPIQVKAEISSKAQSVRLNAHLSYDYKMPCDRCMADTTSHSSLVIDSLLTKEDCEDLSDEFITVGDEIDLDEFLYGEIILNLPVKYVCEDDCKGLCETCGVNLNVEQCSCNKQKIDPRLEVLKLLLEDE